MSTSRALFITIAAITFLGFMLRLGGIQSQPPTMDETQTVFSAENYIMHGQFGPTMPNHPNLRNILVYVSTRIDKGALGLRGFSILFGTLSIPLLALMAYQITRNATIAALSAFFIAIDPVHITFSRQSIQEVHTAFFFILGVAAFFIYRQRQDASSPVSYSILALSGIAFGLGLASKAHALFPLAACMIIALMDARRIKSWHRAALLVSALVLLPLGVYMLTYIPWFMRGYGLGDWLFMQLALAKTTAMHAGNPMDSMIDTKPALWFIKPLMGYGNFVDLDGTPFVTIAMGNPMVWLAVMPSAVYAMRKRNDNAGYGIMLALFALSYLPLALSSRPIWVMSSIAVTPFAYGLVAILSEAAMKRYGKAALSAYLCAALLVSLLLYPMSIGRGWSHDYLRPIVERFSPHTQPILKQDQY